MHPYFFDTVRLPDDFEHRPKPRRGAAEMLKISPFHQRLMFPHEIPVPERSTSPQELIDDPRFDMSGPAKRRGGGLIRAFKRRKIPAPAF